MVLSDPLEYFYLVILTVHKDDLFFVFLLKFKEGAVSAETITICVIIINKFYPEDSFSQVKGHNVLGPGFFLDFCVEFHCFSFCACPWKSLYPSVFIWDDDLHFYEIELHIFNLRYIFDRKFVHNYHMKTANHPPARPTLKFLFCSFYVYSEREQTSTCFLLKSLILYYILCVVHEAITKPLAVFLL